MNRRALGWLAAAVAGCGHASTPTPPPPAATETVVQRPAPDEVRPLDSGPAPVAAPVSAAPTLVQDLSPWANRSDLLAPPSPQLPDGPLVRGLERWKLTNGLEVVLVPRPGVRTVSVAVAVRAGTADELAGQSGLATVTAGALRTGTTHRTAEALGQELWAASAELDTTAGAELTTSTCRALATHAATCLELVADLMLAPTFPEDAFDATKERAAETIRRRSGDPLALAAAHLDDLALGEQHPSGRVPTADGVRRLRREAAVGFWRRLYRPNNAAVVIVGDLSATTARAAVQRHFGAWKPIALPTPGPVTTPRRQGTRVLLIDEPQTRGALLLLGRAATGVDDRARPVLSLLGALLGGPEPQSRLRRELVARGMAGDARVELEPLRGAIELRVSLATAPDRAWDALVAAAGELRQLGEQEVSPDELLSAAQAFVTRTARAYEDADALATALAEAALVGGGVDRVVGLPAAIAAVKPGAARDVARSTVSPDDLVAVIVGPASAIAPALDRHALNYERIGAADPVSHVERARRRQLVATSIAPVERDRARAVLAAAVEAQGGEKLRRLRELTVVKVGTRRAADVIADIVSTTHYRRPDRVRLEQELVLPTGKSRTVYVIDPARVRGASDDGALGPVPPLNAERLRGAVFEDVLFLPLTLLEAKPAPAMRAMPPVEQDGRRYDVVVVRLPTGEWNELRFDGGTHLLARVIAPLPGGEQLEQRLEDWREVSGVRFPFVQRSSGGGESADAKLRDVKVEPGLSDDLFR